MTVDEPRRPPECRAELTRLNAEDLSTSSDEELASHHKKQSTDERPKELPPNGKFLSRSGSSEKNTLKRPAKTPTLNGSSSESPLKRSPNGSQRENVKNSPSSTQSSKNLLSLAVKRLMSTDQCSVKRHPTVPFVFSGLKRSPLIQELKIESKMAGKIPFKLDGGSEYGRLLSIGAILDPNLIDRLYIGDVLLSANRL